MLRAVFIVFVLFWLSKYVEVDTESLYTDTIELINETKHKLKGEKIDDKRSSSRNN